jgi:ABC-2 type transport system ATP-binding protein
MTSEPAIVVHGLKKSFGELTVLAGIDMQVGRGTVHALLGPNGAGKTTLIRILATLTRPDAGTARVAGFDVLADQHRVRRNISLTGQFAAVDDLQTGAENLRMMARLVGLPSRAVRARVDELLEQFDLAHAARRRVSTYSGGMRRRLDLAASLVGTPAVIFLDEPTTGLDLPSRQAMWEIITRLAGSGVTVLLTTQYLEEADLLADRVAVLDNGRIIANGTADELKARVAERRLDITAANASAYADMERYLGGRVVRADPVGRTLGVATDGSAGHIRTVLDDIDPGRRAVSHFAIHTATLDDVFLALTGHRTTAASADNDTAMGEPVPAATSYAKETAGV